jgi:hypothetical protein
MKDSIDEIFDLVTDVAPDRCASHRTDANANLNATDAASDCTKSRCDQCSAACAERSSYYTAADASDKSADPRTVVLHGKLTRDLR